MLGGDEQQGVGSGEVSLEAGDRRRHRIFVILVVHRQVVDRDEFGLELIGAEADQRLGELAVDGFAPVAADQDAELVLCHGSLYLVVTNNYQGYISDHAENARRHTAHTR